MPTHDDATRRPAFDLRVRDAVDEAEWSALLRADPRSHVAQDPRFLRTLIGARARWMEARDHAGVLRAGIAFEERRRGPLRTRVSGVGGAYGGPVAGPDDAAAEAALAEAFGRRGPLTAHVEMVWAGRIAPRGRWQDLRPLPTLELRIDPARPFDHFLAEVFGRKGRKECNRSERRGFVARREPDARAWADFAAQLDTRSAQWGTQLPSAAVVERLLAEHDTIQLFAVRDARGEVAGVHLALEFPTELFAWIGTTARVEGANPATLLLREEARHAHARRLAGLNLGSSLGIGGVTRYKEMIGATEDARWIVRWQPWWRGAFGIRAGGRAR